MNEVVKEKSRKKQRRELAKKPIRLHSLSRAKWTAPWDDHPLKASLHALWTHGTVIPITYKDIEGISGYGWRTIKSQFQYIILKSIFKQWITIGKEGKKNTYFLDPSKRAIPFDVLCQILEESYYKLKFGPNKPEQLIKQYLDEIEPHQWEYTGDISKKNQFVGKYPDLSHKFSPYLIEFNGLYWHGEPGGIEERKRKRKFAEAGKYTLFLSEHDLKDPQATKEKIKRFRAYDKGLDTPKQIEAFLKKEF